MSIYPEIQASIDQIEMVSKIIPQLMGAKDISKELSKAVIADDLVNLNFICTHNSRRSQFSQVWAYLFSHYFKLEKVHSYSSGTESTEVYPTVIKTLAAQGFRIQQLDESDNPKYAVSIGDTIEPLIIHSKTIDEVKDSLNEFSAIMTCSSADEACPLVSGATSRYQLTFEDPKFSDRTDDEQKVYKAKSVEIASTILNIFKHALSKP